MSKLLSFSQLSFRSVFECTRPRLSSEPRSVSAVDNLDGLSRRLTAEPAVQLFARGVNEPASLFDGHS